MQICSLVAPDGGTFVEAGANDGIRQSNTLQLEEEEGWQGLLIEPSPRAFNHLKKNRPNCQLANVALVSAKHKKEKIEGAFEGGHLTGTVVENLFDRVPSSNSGWLRRRIFHLIATLGFSSHVKKVPVRAQTLESCLAEHAIGSIDFMSLDVEGSEFEVLSGLNLSKHRPKVLLVEVRPEISWRILLWTYINGYLFLTKESSFLEGAFPEWTEDNEDFLLMDKKALQATPALMKMVFDEPTRTSNQIWLGAGN